MVATLPGHTRTHLSCRSSPHPRGAISRAVTRRRLIRQYSVQAQAAVSPFAKPRQDKPAGDSWRRHRARERQHAVDVVPGRCRRRPSSHPVPLLYSTVTACTVYSSRRRAAPTCICEGCSLQYLRLHSAVKTASSCDRPLAPFCRASATHTRLSLEEPQHGEAQAQVRMRFHRVREGAEDQGRNQGKFPHPFHTFSSIMSNRARLHPAFPTQETRQSGDVGRNREARDRKGQRDHE